MGMPGSSAETQSHCCYGWFPSSLTLAESCECPIEVSSNHSSSARGFVRLMMIFQPHRHHVSPQGTNSRTGVIGVLLPPILFPAVPTGVRRATAFMGGWLSRAVADTGTPW